MTEEYGGFCTRCGAPIPSGSNFCPECGASVDGKDNPHASQAGYPPTSDAMDANSVFILVYGVIATLFGIFMLIIPLVFDQTLWNEVITSDPALAGYEYEATMAMMYLGAAFAIPSGVLALVSGYLCKVRKMWAIALVCCIIASIVQFGYAGIYFGIILCAVGLLMSYRIYSNKQNFTS